MHKLLYYPNFEIQDQNFLKFALLYIDEIRPIIPESAKGTLSNAMNDILRDTELINQYTPGYEDGKVASIMAIRYMEDLKIYNQYGEDSLKFKHPLHKCILYREKYSSNFENYCLDNRLGEECREGILINEDIAFIYMTILANIISKENQLDMITDNREYSDPILKNAYSKGVTNRIHRLKIIQKEIQFYVPSDFYKIPLDKFIELRADGKFEKARMNFVYEIEHALDMYDGKEKMIDLYNLTECKNEMRGLLKDIFVSCATVAVGVHSFGNKCPAEMGRLDFWSVVSTGITLQSLIPEFKEVKEFATRIHGKNQARKYLAKIKQLRPEVL